MFKSKTDNKAKFSLFRIIFAIKYTKMELNINIKLIENIDSFILRSLSSLNEHTTRCAMG
jgi:hypothetical protein